MEDISLLKIQHKSFVKLEKKAEDLKFKKEKGSRNLKNRGADLKFYSRAEGQKLKLSRMLDKWLRK